MAGIEEVGCLACDGTVVQRRRLHETSPNDPHAAGACYSALEERRNIESQSSRNRCSVNTRIPRTCTDNRAPCLPSCLDFRSCVSAQNTVFMMVFFNINFWTQLVLIRLSGKGNFINI